MVEPLGELGRRENTHAGRGQFDRERQPVQATADRCHVLVRLEVGLHRSRSLAEQRDRVVLRKRKHGVPLLAGEAQRSTARYKRLYLSCLREKHCDARRGVNHVLKVVQQQQCPLQAQVVSDVLLRAHRLCNRRLDLTFVCERGQRDPPDAVLELVDSFGSHL
jgi:hypothetical protein